MAKQGVLHLGKRGNVDVTEGNIVKHLVARAISLLIGNMFQQLYNMADASVVGNDVSNEAFSAVGPSGTAPVAERAPLLDAQAQDGSTEESANHA